MQTFDLPKGVVALMGRLVDAGHRVYVVGGSVRDALRGLTPHDYDMTTDATPEEMKIVFSGCRVIETGIKHGTLTILADGAPYEITTYRTDGSYGDHRHPDEVSFTRSLKEDLARRDFTMNAIAYHPSEGYIDPFGGKLDIEMHTIRAVGDPTTRFREDALRILRGLRFASTLDYEIQDATAAAVFAECHLLTYVSAERIREELCKLIVGVAAPRILKTYQCVLRVRLPQLPEPTERVLTAVATLPPDPILRLVALMLPVLSDLAQDMDALMRELKFDNASRLRATTLVAHIHADIAPRRAVVLRLLSDIGETCFHDLCTLRHAFALTMAEKEIYSQSIKLCEQLLASGAPYRISDLAIRGNDILTHTVMRGADIGSALQTLLYAVIDGKTENEKDALLSYLKNLQ